ncbi:MAG: DUF167 domain-containing protein [Planctomycetota bacterium]|jgi:uncharacterized protein YggU (UPF0235/DUF167 family)|nr:DUF167 domain-containing protein [Planctomycetota bacterium]
MDFSSLRLEAWEDGSAFPVKAHPRARRNALAGCLAGRLKIEVTAAPEGGEANRAVAKLLAGSLGLPLSGVVLLSGPGASRKRFGVRGLGPARLAAKLAELGEGKPMDKAPGRPHGREKRP